ncbi:hypothetical protein [Hyperthermus butylicus]|uniref:Uncharacterized protein n=1 Tax=Hyperthermus butylicus (strain DSM 5456 / JCM 9403 / PLM1-5) TaxID=415426 RepID=A2BJR5_HYPBU|nr:hypothetical protein [Hyperthermus butylicus]ABM80226.1 hypothetical protein Hbut_0354 [Hyperthermus butylicus DSM 5456]
MERSLQLRSFATPIALWEDEVPSEAPHHVAAASILYYVELRRRRRGLFSGPERVSRLSIVYWPFFITRRSDGRVLLVDLLGLHVFRSRYPVPARLSEAIALAQSIPEVGPHKALDFMRDLWRLLDNVFEYKTVEVPGLVEDVESVEDLVTVSREATVRQDCIIGPLLNPYDAEKMLEVLDKACMEILHTYKMLEQLQQIVMRATQLVVEALDREAEHITGEYGRAIQAVQSRINAKMANVKPELEDIVGKLWDRYSRRMAEIATRIEELKRRGRVEGERAREVARLEKELQRLKRRLEEETETVRKRYSKRIEGEEKEIHNLVRERERKLAEVRKLKHKAVTFSDELLEAINSLLDRVAASRSTLCGAGMIQRQVLGEGPALLHVAIGVAELRRGKGGRRLLLVPPLAAQREPLWGREPISSWRASSRLVARLEEAIHAMKRFGETVEPATEACRVDPKEFKRLAARGLEELVSHGVIAGDRAEELLEALQGYWF